MKRSLVAVAVLFGVSLLGCGEADVEVQSEEELGSATEALCDASIPACEDLDMTGCGRGGDRTNCCLGGKTFVCTCTDVSRVWLCP